MWCILCGLKRCCWLLQVVIQNNIKLHIRRLLTEFFFLLLFTSHQHYYTIIIDTASSTIIDDYKQTATAKLTAVDTKTSTNEFFPTE